MSVAMRTYIVITDEGFARVFLRHTIEMFADQIATMAEDWNEVYIVSNPTEWPHWVFITPANRAHLGFGQDKAVAIQRFLREHPGAPGFSPCPVVALVPGEPVTVRLVDPKNPHNLRLVEPASE